MRIMRQQKKNAKQILLTNKIDIYGISKRRAANAFCCRLIADTMPANVCNVSHRRMAMSDRLNRSQSRSTSFTYSVRIIECIWALFMVIEDRSSQLTVKQHVFDFN